MQHYTSGAAYRDAGDLGGFAWILKAHIPVDLNINSGDVETYSATRRHRFLS